MKKNIITLILVLFSNIAFAEVVPLAPALEPLPYELVDVLFEKIENNEEIELKLLHQALQGPQTTLRAYSARLLGEKGNVSSVPYLIDALYDESIHIGAEYAVSGMHTTRYWANKSLIKLTKEDFSFIWNDTKARRIEAINRWQKWYLNKYKAQTNSNDCHKLEKEIKDLFKECQTCNTDQDCYLENEWHRGCPFGCNNILSKSKIDNTDNKELIKSKLKIYRDKCGICRYKCGTPPKNIEIGCRNNKCVDLRYYKDK